jgi:hypothetical protein
VSSKANSTPFGRIGGEARSGGGSKPTGGAAAKRGGVCVNKPPGRVCVLKTPRAPLGRKIASLRRAKPPPRAAVRRPPAPPGPVPAVPGAQAGIGRGRGINGGALYLSSRRDKASRGRPTGPRSHCLDVQQAARTSEAASKGPCACFGISLSLTRSRRAPYRCCGWDMPQCRRRDCHDPVDRWNRPKLPPLRSARGVQGTRVIWPLAPPAK